MVESATRSEYVIAPEPREGRRMPWRKIHLDFHNSRHVGNVGEAFDAEEFVGALKGAHVDSIVVFAKDMHGYCYYPSAIGPVHPGLKRDLLGEQVAACRKAGIEVYSYYCTLWDHHLAFQHPEWLSIRRDGTTYLPAPGEPPEWTALCASNEALVDHIKAHLREILTAYEVDGIWFDMPVPRDSECFCTNCVASLVDPYDVPAQRSHQQKLHTAFLQSLYEFSKEMRPGCQVDFNNQPAFGLADRIEWMDSVDIEALPTDKWGYDFFPTVARYVRTFPRTSYGMTGRFLKGWGDFGGLKTGHQLTSECFGILSVGAKCDIGDQMAPSGRLDPAEYKSIGAAYREVAQIETVLDGARSVAEAAIVLEGQPLDSLATPSTCALAKALAELSIQFDIVEASQDWRQYPVALIPTAGKHLAEDVFDYIHSGGKAVVLDGPLLEQLNAHKSAFTPAYAFLPGEYAYAIYGETYAWPPDPSGHIVGFLGEPAFNRSGESYTSHLHAPLCHETDLAIAEVRGSLGLIGFDLGRLYSETGYWFYRDLLQKMVSRLSPRQLVKPVNTGIVQATVSRKGEKWLVHVLDTSTARPAPGHPPYYENAPPRANVEFRLNLGEGAFSCHAVRASRDLPCEPGAEGYGVVIPLLDRYELLVFSGGG